MNGNVLDTAPRLFWTAICAVPAVVNSAAGMVAAICAASIWLGAIVVGVPPGGVKDTADPPEKPDPLIVTEVSGLSSETLPGVTLEIEACGRADAVIVNGSVLDTAPRLFWTAICAVPAVVNSAAGMVAAICAANIWLGAIVVGVPPGGVNDTAEPPVKPAPLIVTEVSGLNSETLPGNC